MKRTASLITLTLLAVIGISLTYWVDRLNAPQIAAGQRQIDSHRLLDILASDSYDNQPLEQPLALGNIVLNHSTLSGGYRATKAGKTVAVLLRSQTQGYAATIELLVAIDSNGKMLGVKTLRQNETPALGGHIGDWPNAWLGMFTGRSADAPGDAGWALKKDQGQFDQIAGATITSRAVIDAIHDALRYFDEHRATLLGTGT